MAWAKPAERTVELLDGLLSKHATATHRADVEADAARRRAPLCA